MNRITEIQDIIDSLDNMRVTTTDLEAKDDIIFLRDAVSDLAALVKAIERQLNEHTH